LFLITLISGYSLHAQNPFLGTWQVGEPGKPEFGLQINADRSVETTRILHEEKYSTEVGHWRLELDSKMSIQLNSGWTFILVLNSGHMVCVGYEPDQAYAENSFSFPVERSKKQSLWESVPENTFVGYWQLMDEKEEVFYLNTRYDHEAQSTYADGVNGVFGEIGIWRYEGNRILIAYNSGWIDIITYHNGKFLKASYAPGQKLYTEPNNYSTAVKLEKLPVNND
jgi:hypothetical protein